MKLIYVIIGLAFISCTSPQHDEQSGNESNSNQPNEITFDQFVDLIPNYEFPVRMSCDFEKPTLKLNLDNHSKYFPDGGRIVSKLPSNGDFRLIIFDFPCDYSCPTLFSHDADGKRMDSLNLTPGQCAEDGNMKSSQWFKIDEDIHIELIDTTHYFSDRNTTQTIDSTTVKIQRYLLNDTGKFDLISETTQLLP